MNVSRDEDEAGGLSALEDVVETLEGIRVAAPVLHKG